MQGKAADILSHAGHVTAFTGAGISVESGIPTFRGPNGLWSKFDPVFLDIDYFRNHPLDSWKLIKKIFYDFFGKAEPNYAHAALSAMELSGLLNCVVTQNIDDLHQKAGSRDVLEFHGTSMRLVCMGCGLSFPAANTDLSTLPPQCPECGAVLKPDFVFFGEPIPQDIALRSFGETELADVFLVIGTTGEIMPASAIPVQAKKNGAKIIEINTSPSNYTSSITDVFLLGKATTVMEKLMKDLDLYETDNSLRQHNRKP